MPCSSLLGRCSVPDFSLLRETLPLFGAFRSRRWGHAARPIQIRASSTTSTSAAAATPRAPQLPEVGQAIPVPSTLRILSPLAVAANPFHTRADEDGDEDEGGYDAAGLEEAAAGDSFSHSLKGNPFPSRAT